MATLLLIIIYITFISLGLPDSMLGSSFPAIAQNLGVSSDMAGYVGMVVSLCTIISSLLSSYLIKRFSTKIVVSVSVVLTAVALLLFSFVRDGYTWAFYIIALPLGLGAGAIDSALNNYVALHYKAIHMNWLHAFWGIGASVGPLIIGSFIDSNNNSSGWDYGVLTIACIQLGISLILFLTLPLWNKVMEKENGEKKEEKKEEEVKGDKDEAKKVLTNPIFYLTALGFFCYCALESSTGLWVGNFFHIEMGSSTDEAAMLTSTFYIGITVGRLLCGPISLKLNEKQMIRMGEIIIAVGIALTFMRFNKYVPMVGFVVVGLGCAPIYPAIIRSTPYRFSKTLSQRAMGLEMATAYVGGLSMPPLIGLIARLMGDNYSILPYFMCGFAVAMIVCHEIINMILRKRDSSLSEEQLKEYKA